MARRKKHAKPKPVFRNKVGAELVDELLYRFVALVKHGLACASLNTTTLNC